jgi:excisionase family DNA binding protein
MNRVRLAGGKTFRSGAAGIGASRDVLQVGVLLEDAVLPEPWVHVEDVARHLSVSKHTKYLWLEAQQLPAHKAGRVWKFKLHEVDEWARAGGAAEAGRKPDGGAP